MFTFKMIAASAAFALPLALGQAQAQTPEPDVKQLVTPQVLEEMYKIVSSDIVRISVNAQNEKLRTCPRQTSTRSTSSGSRNARATTNR